MGIGFIVVFLSFYASHGSSNNFIFPFYDLLIAQMFNLYQLFSIKYFPDSTWTESNINTIVFVIVLALPGFLMVIAAISSKAGTLRKALTISFIVFFSFILFVFFGPQLVVLITYLLLIVLFILINFCKVVRIMSAVMLFIFCGLSIHYFQE